MSQTNPFVPGWVYHDPFYSVGPFTLKIFQVLATFMVSAIIISSWPNLLLVQKILAVELLADLSFFPTLVRWREKRSGKKVDGSIFALNSYRWAMMFAMVLLRIR